MMALGEARAIVDLADALRLVGGAFGSTAEQAAIRLTALHAERIREAELIVRGPSARAIEVKEPPAPPKVQPSFLAFPQEGYMALELPNSMIPSEEERRGSSGMLVRFRTSTGFQAFMLSAIETASLVWPDIAAEWDDEKKGGDA